jgi:pilus assembly protein Flp/PilA
MGGREAPFLNYGKEGSMRNLMKFMTSESGASAAEYALILAIIAAAIVTALGVLSTDIQTAIDNAGAIINP